MEDFNGKDYKLINREEHTTNNPEYVKAKVRELYPESEGYKVEFEVIDASGPISERGNKTIVIDIYKEKKNKKTF